jgi:hypothetical protein
MTAAIRSPLLHIRKPSPVDKDRLEHWLSASAGCVGRRPHGHAGPQALEPLDDHLLVAIETRGDDDVRAAFAAGLYAARCISTPAILTLTIASTAPTV